MVIVACTPSSQEPLQGASDIAEFERRLESLRTRLAVPGMSAAIGRDGAIAWTKTFGFADVAAQRPPADTTAFHLASLTKLFGTVVLLRLVDSGLVSLDDPVSKFGISLPNSDAIRVRHLLSMTSGGSVPGETFAYNGDRFALLDEVIRRGSGRTFAELAMEWIIRPLGMSHTAPNVDSPAFAVSGLDPRVYVTTIATPYAVRDGTAQPSAYPTLFSVAAGMISTPSDVVRFVQALDAGRVLSPSMRDKMFAPTVTARGVTLPYAFGCFSQVYQGTRIVWAYGLWTSISSLLIHVPDRDLTFVVTANADRLSSPYPLGAGRLLESPLAQEFLSAFVFNGSKSPL